MSGVAFGTATQQSQFSVTKKSPRLNSAGGGWRDRKTRIPQSSFRQFRESQGDRLLG